MRSIGAEGCWRIFWITKGTPEKQVWCQTDHKASAEYVRNLFANLEVEMELRLRLEVMAAAHPG